MEHTCHYCAKRLPKSEGVIIITPPTGVASHALYYCAEHFVMVANNIYSLRLSAPLFDPTVPF